MDYRKENYCFDNRKYSNGRGFDPQNTFTNLRYQNKRRNPRDYQNVNTPRDYQNVRMPRYHENDKDFRPEPYKHFRPEPYRDFRPESYRDFRPEPYKRDFHFKDRDDRPLLSEVDIKEKERNRSTTVIKKEPGLNYVSNVRNVESGNNERKLLIDDEDFKNWNIGVEFNVTSDRPKKLHWQTKEQMDSYGMVGGHFHNEDRQTGEIFKCSLYGQCGLPQRESTGRSRSMSKPREPQTNSRPKPVRPRSRSVCFSEEITHFEYEKEDESDMNDFSSQDKMEIDDDDTSRSDVLESEIIDEQSSERKKITENSKSGIASVKSSSSKNSDNRIKKKLVNDSIQDLRSNKDSEKLVKDSEQDLRSNEDGEELVKDSEQDLRSNEDDEKLVKDSEKDLRSNEDGEELVKDSEQDVRNNDGGDNPEKKVLVQDVRINEGADKPGKLLVQDLRLSEFVCLFVNKPLEDSVQDMESNDGINNSPYKLGVNICSRSSDNQPLSKLPLKDKMSSVKSQKKFHGFSKDFSTDLRQLELRTSIIKMQNQYEEDCQEFAQSSYDVIMESTLTDINQTCHDSSQVDVHKAETIFDVKLSDSFQDYLIPIEDIFEDVAVHMVNTDEPLLMSQEEEFDAETSVALSTVLRSPEMSTPVDNDLLSLRQESSLPRYSPTLEFKTDVELGRAQFESRRWNPQVMVEDIKTCQNVLQLNGVHNVPEDPTDNETSKPNEYQLDSHVQNKKTESDIENNCLQNLNLNYLDKKPTSLKMKIFKAKGNKFKVKNIEDDATQDIVHSQTASPLCPPAIASKSSSESKKESSRFSTSSPLLQLRSCVFCSVCGLKVPRSFVEPGVMLGDMSGWQCQDCAVCILCFLRNPGEQLLVCCQCDHRYHKTCARVDQMAQQGSWVCKYCTAK